MRFSGGKMKNEEIKVVKPIEIENRVFYPLVKVFHWKNHQSEFYSLSPVALVVVEGKRKYLLPLDKMESSQELLSMITH